MKLLSRTTINSLAVLAASLFASVALGEIAIRVYAKANRPFGARIREFDPSAVLIEPHGSLGYRQRPNSVFRYINGTKATSNDEGYRGPVVPRQPDPGTTRIELLGGSTTHGWGVRDDQTIDAHMRRILSQRYPGRRFEVVNLGFDGYDSYQDLQRLQSDGLPRQPAIIIANTGINDVTNAWIPGFTEADPRSLMWESVLTRLRAERSAGGPTLWTRLKGALLIARIPGFVREQLALGARARQRAGRATAGLVRADSDGGAPRPGGPPYPEAAVYFERNVRQIVDATIRSGAAVLLSTPASALRMYPDTATSTQSYWVYNAATTQAYRDDLARRLERIASEDAAKGVAVRYVAPNLPRPDFLDDCHLTSEGNRIVAEVFVDAIAPFLKPHGGTNVAGTR
jgi:lysophospholipase L1-like esterase